ncbi:MAG: YfhO family protein [Eubacterium sp.]|nr:YfhO family protein [Eubacterium sp.]
MNKKGRLIGCIAAPVLTVLILLAVFAAKGIYPFGSGTLIGGDFYQIGMPGVYYFYDAVKDGSLFYDLTTAGGFPRSLLMYLLKPTQFIYLLFKREMLINAFSYYILLKFSITAFTSVFSFQRIFEKLSYGGALLLSLIYTFCGYNIQYYTNTDWLTAASLYPLLILFLYNMFKGESKLPFVLTLVYLLVSQTYMAYFAVVSLVIFGGLYILLVSEKKERKKQAYALGSATLISLVSAAYPVYIFLADKFSSARFVEYGMADEAHGTLLERLCKIAFAGVYENVIPTLMFIGSELAVASVALLVIHATKEPSGRRTALFFSLSAVLLYIQSVSYGSELLWHGGSRLLFPYRNGYMVAFLACLAVGWYFSNADRINTDTLFEKKAFKISIACFAAVCTAGVIIVSAEYFKLTGVYNVISPDAAQNGYRRYILALILFVAGIYFALLLIKNKKIKTAAVFSLAAVLICVNTYSFVGNAEGSAAEKAYNGYYKDCFETDAMINGNDELERVSNPDLSLITNYAYFGDFSSVSNWTHNLSEEHLSSYKRLGNTVVYTRIPDSGGTAFTKALLRITDSVSKEELNGRLYEKQEVSPSGFIKYKNRFVFPAGVTCSDSIKSIDYVDCENTFEYQNAIYESISGDTGLFENAELVSKGYRQTTNAEYIDSVYRTAGIKNPNPPLNKKEAEKKVIIGSYVIRTKSDSTLYIKVNSKDTSFYKMTVNGGLVTVNNKPEAKNHDTNTKYPIGFNSGTLELGSFNGEEVRFDYVYLNGDMSEVDFYLMDNGKLERLCNRLGEGEYAVNKDRIEINAEADRDGYLFVPVTYSEDWICSVNGEAAETVKVLNNFTAVKVKSGENRLTMRFSHKRAYLGAFLSFAGFAAAAVLVLLEKRLKLPDAVYRIAYGAFTALVIVTLTVFYVLPIIGALS